MSDGQTPTWRYLVPGVIFLCMAGYLLIHGEIPVDKAKSMTLTRAGNPFIYWTTVLVTGTVGVLALRKVWKRLTS